MRQHFRTVLLVAAVAFGLAAEAHSSSNPSVRAAVDAAAPPGLVSRWSVPDQLLQEPGSPVEEASLATFEDASGNAKLAVLILRTSTALNGPRGVYAHDYRTCQSLHLGNLVSWGSVTIRSGVFPILRVRRPGIEEHEISFIARLDGEKFDIDSSVFGWMYPIKAASKVFNFQVWSGSSTATVGAVEAILQNLEGSSLVSYSNQIPIADPVTWVESAKMSSGNVMMLLSRPLPFDSLGVTAVVWARPNPAPVAATWVEDVRFGRRHIRFDLDRIRDGATDAEITVSVGGKVADRVFVSFNGYGLNGSSWFPFADTQSVFEIARVAGGPPLIQEANVVPLNSSTVRFRGNLGGASSFVGAFVEVLPQLKRSDLSRFKAVRFWRRSDGVGRDYTFKLELRDGRAYEKTFRADSTWAPEEIAFHDLLNRSGWDEVATDVRRLVVAAVAGSGESRHVDLQLSRLSLVPAVDSVLCGDADGSGAVGVADGVQALRAAAELSTSCVPARCDIDRSGSVTVSDGVSILRIAADLAVEDPCREKRAESGRTRNAGGVLGAVE